jgi:hypothetical protein
MLLLPLSVLVTESDAAIHSLAAPELRQVPAWQVGRLY